MPAQDRDEGAGALREGHRVLLLPGAITADQVQSLDTSGCQNPDVTLCPGTRPPVNRKHANKRPAPKIIKGTNHRRREGVPSGSTQLFSGSARRPVLQEGAQDAPLRLSEAPAPIPAAHRATTLRAEAYAGAETGR